MPTRVYRPFVLLSLPGLRERERWGKVKERRGERGEGARVQNRMGVLERSCRNLAL